MASTRKQSAFFLGRRLIAAVITLVGLSIAVFLMVKLIPGDEAKVAAGPNATPQQVAAMTKTLGLNEPVVVQYLDFLGRLLHGDLGTSITTQAPVLTGIKQALPPTIELVVIAVIGMVVVITPLATISALRRETKLDLGIRTTVIVCAGLPTFWLALISQFILGSKLGLLPIAGQLSRDMNVTSHTGAPVLDALIDGQPLAAWDAVQHLALPAAVLALPFAAQLYRVMRAELIRVLAREHLTVARAKGIPQRNLVRKHVLPNAAGPGLTVVGIQFGAMLGAAVLVESVFGLPGIGSYLMNAVSQKDTFAVLGGVLAIGTIVVLTNLVVDIIQLIRDPRLRAGQLGA